MCCSTTCSPMTRGQAQHVLVRTRSSGIRCTPSNSRAARQQGWSGSIPHSTRSLISARLDLLAPVERALLSAGAAADQPFGPAQLAAMQGVDTANAELALRHLVDKALLSATARDELSFTHDLVREVTYEHLSRSARSRLHEAAASWMEQRAGDRLADDAMRIANQLAAAAAAREEDGEDAAELRAHVFRLTLVAGDRLRGLGIEDDMRAVSRCGGRSIFRPQISPSCSVNGAIALARIGPPQRGCGRRPHRFGRRTPVGNVAPGPPVRGGRMRSNGSAATRRRASGPSNRPWRSSTTADGSGCDRGHRQPGVHHRMLGRRRRPSPSPSAAGPRSRTWAGRSGGSVPQRRGAAMLLQGNIEGYTDFMRALTRALEAGRGTRARMAYHTLAELQLQGWARRRAPR